MYIVAKKDLKALQLKLNDSAQINMTVFIKCLSEKF